MNIRPLFKYSALGFAAIIGMFLMFYAGPMGFLITAKRQIRDAPWMWNVPRPLSVVDAASSAGRHFSYFGYELTSPWVNLKNERVFQSAVSLNFSTGNLIVIFDPSGTANDLTSMKREAAKRGTNLRDMFGDEATRSNYALYSKILSLTPRELQFSFSRQEMVGNSILITLKYVDTGLTRGGLFSFQTEWLRGFQKGDPAVDKVVIVEGFDKRDQKIQIFIGSETTAGNRTSQAEINQILRSLRPSLPQQ
jgi:hypothetical protein